MNVTALDATPDTLLTLLFPSDVENTVIDHLLAHPEWAPGFTCATVEGHGDAMLPRDPAERVRGRSRRFQVQVALSRAQADALIDHFRESLGNPDVFYWLVPLTGIGRMS